MEHKRLTLFAGHYGSGKTNIAVNYALHLAKEGKQVCIADLDIVNPYFRTADSRQELEKAGVELISPQFANSNVDLPALPAQAYKLVQDKRFYGIMDIGGDDRGAYALGRYVPYMKQEKNYRMAYVANCYRPLTRTAAEALEVMREIEEACGLAFTDIVNNSNLAAETDAPAVLDSLDFIRELSELSGLPVFMTTVRADLAEALREHIPNILPLRLQEKYFDLPDQKTEYYRRRNLYGKSNVSNGSLQGLRLMRQRLPQGHSGHCGGQDQQQRLFTCGHDRSGQVHRLRFLRYHVP